ncbi:ABZJ_00895 family protein [Roseovarius pelagicus]|uniref:ABZJ_00895 family protein n=1 Tax=Roseovarius pelagicus TaxID=2980108 RepID=A0ABY6DEI6_9RHOB|nr:ABZJ_00895 family protein [Roseovarius pelagicus]UXX84490.1 ABZJ_00895 family protein [Roseovarius pelagicus]
MIYLRYSLVFLAVALGAGVVVRLLEGRVSELGASTQLIVPAMVAALIEGHRYARTHRQRVPRAELWGFVWIATALATALNLALAYLAGGLLPEFGKLTIASFGSQQFLILLGIYTGAYLISNRFFYGIGTSTELGRQAQKDNK